MGNNSIAIFPASGGIGGGTYRHLINLVDAKNVILVARSPDKIPEKYRNAGAVTRYGDYDHLETLDHAFDGARYLNLISYASIDHEYRYKVRKKTKYIKEYNTKLVDRSRSTLSTQPSSPASHMSFTPPSASQAILLTLWPS